MQRNRARNIAVFVAGIVACYGYATGQNLNIESDPLKIRGGISARAAFYAADGIEARRVPFSWVLTGNITPEIYGVSVPLSFTLSEQERSTSQPFNQFGLSTSYQWITLHGGFRNLTYGTFTLANHQFLGGAVDLKPGDFRIGFMTGRLRRAVEQDTNNLAVVPSYERTGTAAYIGYESPEVRLMINGLSAIDDTNSLRTQPVGIGYEPGQNVAVGARFSLSPISAMSLDVEWAVSAYTRDIRAAEAKISDPTLHSLANSIMTPRTSTNVYQALRSQLQMRFGAFDATLSYSRIDPDYRSMGAYAMNTDQQIIGVAPTFFVRDANLRVALSVQHISDNLQNKKTATTTRIVPTLVAGWTPSASFGLDIQVADVFTSQANGNMVLADSMRMSSRSPSLSFSPRYSIFGDSSTHTFSATITGQSYIDHTPSTAAFASYDAATANISYSGTVPSSQWTYGCGVFASLFNGFTGTFTTTGVTATGGKAIPEHGINTSANLSIGFGTTTTTSLNVTGSWTPGRQHAINSSITYTHATFNEFTATVGYAYSF